MSLNDRDWYITYGVYSAVGIQLAASVVGGLWLGSYLDSRFRTQPWLLLTGLIVGSVGGFWNLFTMVKWFERRRRDRKS